MEKSNNQFENNKKSVIKIETSFNSQINSNNLNISSNNKINTVKNSTIKSNYNNINSLNLFESQNNNIYQNYEPKALKENKKESNKYRIRIRFNRNKKLTVDRYIQKKDSMDPFDDSFNEKIVKYQNYEPKALNEDITNIEKAVRYIIFIF